MSIPRRRPDRVNYLQRRKSLLLKDETVKGFMYIIANSRSGHNFIANNVYSWMGYEDLKNPENKLKYINLENLEIDSFLDVYEDDYNHESSALFSVRSLSNWFASIYYFFLNRRDEESQTAMSLKVEDVLTREEYKKLRLESKPVPPHLLVMPRRETDKEKHLHNLKFPEEHIISRINNFLDMWLSYSKEFIGETNIMKNIPVKIYYDEFVKSQEYRKSICEKVGGEYNETNINLVPKPGRGSTFDKLTYDGEGSKMEVHKRYEQLQNVRDVYIKEFLNHEALYYYFNNFDVSIEEKDFINSLK